MAAYIDRKANRDFGALSTNKLGRYFFICEEEVEGGKVSLPDIVCAGYTIQRVTIKNFNREKANFLILYEVASKKYGCMIAHI